MEGEDLSIFFINIPSSKKLITQIFKMLTTHQAVFLEIPSKDQLHNEILSLDEKIGELRIVIRKSSFGLDEKLEVYYNSRAIEEPEDNLYETDFYSPDNAEENSKLFNYKREGDC